MIKAGSIVPMGPFIQYSTEKPADPIELRIYPGANGSFTLYEDEGDNYNYEKASMRRLRFIGTIQSASLQSKPERGNFPGILKTRTFQIVMVSKSHGVGVESPAIGQGDFVQRRRTDNSVVTVISEPAVRNSILLFVSRIAHLFRNSKIFSPQS